MANIEQLLAQASAENVSPEQRAKLYKLMMQGQAFTNAPDPTVNLTGPFSREPEGFSLAGKALLSTPQDQSPTPTATSPVDVVPPPNLPSLKDTTGGQMLEKALARRKNVKWWMPDFMANRNDKDIALALEMARTEMGGEATKAESSQRYMNILADDLARKDSRNIARAEFGARENDRELSRMLTQQEMTLRQGRYESDAASAERKLRADITDRNRDAGLRSRELGIREGQLDLARSTATAKPETWESALARGLPELLKPNLMGEPPTNEQVDAAVGQYKRILGGGGGARRPAPAPLVPSHAVPPPSTGGVTRFVRDPQTGQLVRAQ